ncbi:MAG TPA: hypothetical protein DIV56_01765 [Lachnospiraceae bacterium]|nr:hypothetical protein [Lachnospiraceae bacterium]
MATDQQISNLLQQMAAAHPGEFYKHMGDTRAGIGAVLKLLYTADTSITAGMISERLDISTARVAVLLKKMVAKGLITKEKDPIDARVTIVKLTEYGRETIEHMWADVKAQMGKVIDEIGEDRLLEYIEINKEIRRIVTPPVYHL